MSNELQKAPSLTRYAPDSLVTRTEGITRLDNNALKRYAKRAANTRDLEQLWTLTAAHLMMYGRKGSRLSPHTLRAYHYGIEVLLGMWQGVNLLRPPRDAGVLYMRRLETRGNSPGTVSARLSAAKCLYRALIWADAVEGSPFENVHPPEDPNPPESKRRAYTSEQVEALLSNATLDEAVQVLLTAHGGLRTSETLALTWADVNLNSSSLRIRNGKGRTDASIAMTPRLTEALSAWKARVSHAKPRDRVLTFGSDTTARRRLQRLCDRAGVEYLGIHSLRHYCGTNLLESSGSLLIVKRHLRHRSVAVTQIYAKQSQEKYSEGVRGLE